MAPKGKRFFSVGVDYGTNSVRALVVDLADGHEIATAVYAYPSGRGGVLTDPRDPNLARQHPGDYITGFVASVQRAVRAARKVAGFSTQQVVGLGIDTTGSTPLPVARDGTPLGMTPRFVKQLAAQAWLWKDHTAHAEAQEITDLAQRRGEPYLAKCGGTYSSEWFWAKILRCRRAAPKVFDAAWSWVELADFVPAWITGNADPARLVRGVCAAGHKAMFSDQWGGLPSEAFLGALDPALADLRPRLYDQVAPSSEAAGGLTADFAKRVGLPAGLPVAVGAFDAHHGAVGAGVKPGTLVKIIGTSTCDITVWPMDRPLADIPGLCGIVPGSVTPGGLGLEAGQSAVGDIFNWFAEGLAPPRYARGNAHAALTRDAARLTPGESGLLALDWNNGNRTVLVNPRLTGLLVGQTLHTTAPEVYRALVEATAFGARTIIERLERYGVGVREVVNCGGIAEKNPLVMQVYADVCNRPMKISRSAQTCALGAALFGAVAGGAFKSVSAAQRKMTGVKPKVYRPRKAAAAVYDELYALYRTLHDGFGEPGGVAAVGAVMPRLIAIRDRQRGVGSKPRA